MTRKSSTTRVTELAWPRHAWRRGSHPGSPVNGCCYCCHPPWWVGVKLCGAFHKWFIWLVVWNHGILLYDFPYIGNNHPNWLSYFSEGLKPPTSLWLVYEIPLMVKFDSSLLVNLGVSINGSPVNGWFTLWQADSTGWSGGTPSLGTPQMVDTPKRHFWYCRGKWRCVVNHWVWIPNFEGDMTVAFGDFSTKFGVEICVLMILKSL